MEEGKMNHTLGGNAIKRVTFPDLDVAKFLMAFLVVEIHTRPFGNGPIVQGIDCVAVPFFFIASAFLCFRGLAAADLADGGSAACARVWKTTKKLLRLYLTWTVVFIPVSVFGFAMNGVEPAKAVVSFVRGTLLVGENIYSWPLWYLLASAVAFFLVLVLLQRRVCPRCVLAIAAGFALLGFAISCAHEWGGAPALLARPVGLYFKLFGNVHNGLFEGFLYVALGMCLGLKWERAAAVSPAASAAMAVLGAAVCVGDARCAPAVLRAFRARRVPAVGAPPRRERGAARAAAQCEHGDLSDAHDFCGGVHLWDIRQHRPRDHDELAGASHGDVRVRGGVLASDVGGGVEAGPQEQGRQGAVRLLITQRPLGLGGD